MNEPRAKAAVESVHSPEDFTETHWTEVALAAEQDGSDQARQALEALCLDYWPAIYGFLRRSRHAPADAEDLTQGFFAHLIQARSFMRADRSKGRFRNFLLGALKRFLADEQRRQGAQKRGRDRVVRAFDFQLTEDWYLEEADHNLTPDQIYDRRWAADVLEGAFRELNAEFSAAGQVARFNCLNRFLAEEADAGAYEAAVAELNITVKSVSSAVARLRERYRELVRRRVLQTVSNDREADGEFEELFR